MHENMEDDAAADRDGGVLSYAQLTGMTIQAWSPLYIAAGNDLP